MLLTGDFSTKSGKKLVIRKWQESIHYLNDIRNGQILIQFVQMNKMLLGSIKYEDKKTHKVQE